MAFNAENPSKQLDSQLEKESTLELLEIVDEQSQEPNETTLADNIITTEKVTEKDDTITLQTQRVQSNSPGIEKEIDILRPHPQEEEKSDLLEAISVEDFEDEILEYASPEVKQHSHEDLEHTEDIDYTTKDSYLPIPIILESGSFPYLLAPLKPDSEISLPTSYEDLIILFDDGVDFSLTIFQILQKIRSTFKELENPFKIYDELSLNFKEFGLTLNETSSHAHDVTLTDIIKAFDSLINSTSKDSLSCLHIELTSQKNFVERLRDIQSLIKNRHNEVILVEDEEEPISKHEGEGHEEIIVVEDDEVDFKLSEEEKRELDDSLSPEKAASVDKEEDENTNFKEDNTTSTTDALIEIPEINEKDNIVDDSETDEVDADSGDARMVIKRSLEALEYKTEEPFSEPVGKRQK